MAVRLAVATSQLGKTFGPTVVRIPGFSESANALYSLLARRAFELFENRGRASGYDLDDWFRAEAELLHTAHLQVTESDDAFAVLAEVPGFSALELEVIVEPRRVAIGGNKGKRQRHPAKRLIYCDRCPDRISRVINFPAVVDSQKATAKLRHGILELAMPKALVSTRLLMGAKSDWIVRVADYRAATVVADSGGQS